MASSPSPSAGGDPNACNDSSSNNKPPSEGGLSNLINEYPLSSFPTTTAIGFWTESSVAAGSSLGAAALQHHTANHARVLRETLATQGEGPSALQLLKPQNIDRLREAWPAAQQQQQPSQSQVREKPDDSRRARTPMRPSPKLRYVLWTSASSSPQAPLSPLSILCQIFLLSHFSHVYCHSASPARYSVRFFNRLPPFDPFFCW
ncbi:hypothetical protein GQ607_015228 [Colletotrichum asianum]|uniref:Uncharacterized protein n=1 Tax=Colletotrichum asianum TaxID=702518 RepID=A0A8H3W132_9PEZI|nr:hypothetical protein GQ607_015228 [Colletotrichum asianum]